MQLVASFLTYGSHGDIIEIKKDAAPIHDHVSRHLIWLWGFGVTYALQALGLQRLSFPILPLHKPPGSLHLVLVAS